MIYRYVFATESGWLRCRSRTLEEELMPGLGILTVNKQIGAEANMALKSGCMNVTRAVQNGIQDRWAFAPRFQHLRYVWTIKAEPISWEDKDAQISTPLGMLVDKLAEVHRHSARKPPVTLALDVRSRLSFDYKHISVAPELSAGKLSYRAVTYFYKAQVDELVRRVREAIAQALPGAKLTSSMDATLQMWPDHLELRRIDGDTVRFRDQRLMQMGTLKATTSTSENSASHDWCLITSKFETYDAYSAL